MHATDQGWREDAGARPIAGAPRAAGVATVLGGLISAAGAVLVQGFVQPGTTIPDNRWSFPWSSHALIWISVIWAVGHALVIAGLVGLRRSGAAGPGQGARVGIGLAVCGTALLLVGELASIPVRTSRTDATGAELVGAIFAVGTVLAAIGLLLAGRATLRAGVWQDWRRFTPLLVGLSLIVVVPLTFTKALATGVGVYGLCLLALGVALTEDVPRRS
jgi:hypothetical protein